MTDLVFNDKSEILINGEWINFREAFQKMTPEEWAEAAVVLGRKKWDNETRFCARCGAPLKSAPAEKMCESCGAEFFPNPTPAIVVLVTRGEQRDEALLVHAKTLPTDVHALVAGFVETDRSLESCVAREVAEETGLKIGDIRYWGSQYWPYPHQLMIAFTARLALDSPELSFPDGELNAGAFFNRKDPDSLPTLPRPASLTRRLIDAWLHFDF